MATATLIPKLKAYRICYINPIPVYVDEESLAFGALLSALAHEDITVFPYFPFTVWHDEKGLIEFDWEPPEPWEKA